MSTRIHMLGDSVHQGPVDNLVVPDATVVGYSVCLEGEQRSKKGNRNLPRDWISFLIFKYENGTISLIIQEAIP